MVEFKIPASERGKLFPYVSDKLALPIFVSFVVLSILLFESAGISKTNPFIFYSVPFLFMIVSLTISNVTIIRSTLGLGFRNLRETLIVLASLPVGWFVGLGLVRLAINNVAIFKVATYPWVASTLATAGQLAVLTSTESFFLYLTVAFFEEATAIFLGKNMANWFHLKGRTGVVASILGYLVARLILVSHHWFAYKGFSQPSLYLSATIFFIVFTILAVVVGLIIHRGRTGDDFDELGFIPISMPIAVAAHLAFDFTLSQLSVINITNIIAPLISMIL
jgi:hypothetical protein